MAAKGEDHYLAKLTEQGVREARYLRKLDPAYWTYKRLAEYFGVTWRPIRDAVQGITWKHVIG